MSAPPPPPKYYVPSNRVGPRLLVVFPVVGGGLAIVLGLLYAFVSGLITQVFEAPASYIIATPIFGALLAMAGRAVCYLGQVRRASLRLPILIAVGLVGYYFSWQFYPVMVDHQEIFDPQPAFWMTPARLLHAMVQLSSSEGIGLTLCWLLEAATIFGMIVFLQEEDDAPEAPFCEACGKWTAEVFKLELADTAAQPAAEHLKRGEAAEVLTLPKRPSGTKEWAEVRIFRCPCRVSRYVSVHHAKLDVGKKAGVRYGSITPGAQKEIWFDPGSPDTTHYSPVLVNLVLDEAGEKALAKPF